MRTFALSVLLAAILAGTAFASYKDDVKSGNLLYNKGKYKEAANHYQIAVSANPK